MVRLSLKTYDGIKDRSPLYCAGGAMLLVVMAGREFFVTGEVGARFILMLITTGGFVLAALWLRRRHQQRIEVIEDEKGDEYLSMGKGEVEALVILKSELAYVKQEQDQVVIHYHRGEDLNRISFLTKGANKKKVQELVEYLKTWGG